MRDCLALSFHESYFSPPSWEQELFKHQTRVENHTFSNMLLCHLPGDISRHIRPFELPLPLSTTTAPTSPPNYDNLDANDKLGGNDKGNDQLNSKKVARMTFAISIVASMTIFVTTSMVTSRTISMEISIATSWTIPWKPQWQLPWQLQWQFPWQPQRQSQFATKKPIVRHSCVLTIM